MSDPLRTDEPRALPPQGGVGRDERARDDRVREEKLREEKIEQLLLTGLEHYFAAEYEQAINIWTRALFIDRGHARARAYIERARSAQAERQRESEELLQRGVAAFEIGAAEEARRLLRDAMDQGAPPEEALAILDRLNRLEQVAFPSQPLTIDPAPHAAPTTRQRPTSRAAWAALAGLGVVIIAAAAFAAGAFRGDLAPLLVRPMPATAPKLAIDESPSLPRRGEYALARARALAQLGRLREALAVLDDVRRTDPERADADRMRGDLQKQLIAINTAPASPVARAPVAP